MILEVVDGRFWGVTRPNEPGKGTGIAFPGGKVDAGETPEEAAIRETMEEGIGLRVMMPLQLVHQDLIQGYKILWFCPIRDKRNPNFMDMGAYVLENYKEKGRVQPVLADARQFTTFGNPQAIQSYKMFRAQEELSWLRGDD